MKACVAATLLVLAVVLVVSCSRRDTTQGGLGQAAITVQEPPISSTKAGGPVGGGMPSLSSKGVPSPYGPASVGAEGETGGTDPAERPLLKVQLPGGPGPVAKQGMMAPKGVAPAASTHLSGCT